MTFDEVLGQVIELLRREGRVSYRALKIRCNLDDEYIAALKDDLIEAKHLASDEHGTVLVWVGKKTKKQTAKRRIGESGKAKRSEKSKRSEGQQLIQTRDASRGAQEAERRQLTVLFCDLVGSTALSARLDPEDLREVVRVYQETCTAVIQRYEGHIAQHMGDGLLVYFGYPAAHEDDAQRAVRTGLEIVAALQKQVPSPFHGEGIKLSSGVIASAAKQSLCSGDCFVAGAPRNDVSFPNLMALPRGEREPNTTSLQVRIGIHTGLVVVGEIGSAGKREILALGETPNLAARLQALAEPDMVVISTATRHLITGLFTCRSLGLHELKGVPVPLEVYQVLAESEAQSRFEAAVRAGLTPLVGREQEVGLLLERWEQVKEGRGQVMLLTGEPGIGKSRLVQEIKERVAQEGAIWLEIRCSPYHQNSALYPVIEHLHKFLQFQREDTPQAKLEKLARVLAHYRFPQADTVPLFAALLSLPQPSGYPPLHLSPQKQKQKTQEALVTWLLEEAERTAVFCPWEDLHWADPSTLDFLRLCLDQVSTARVLMLLTFRPEFTPPWETRSHLSQLTLSRLGRKQVVEMVEKLTGSNALPVEVVQQVVAKTDGVPLFVEELTKMVLESGLSVGAQHAAPLLLAIPPTLHDALMARLDRLNTAKEIAQLGAMLGREFSYELLQAVSQLDEEILRKGLAQLVEAELVFQRGLPPQARYIFKHALVQDTAYQSLLKSKRQRLHQQIAQVLEEQFPETRETQPELLAHHYTEAGLIAQAIPYWQQAGQRASERSAYVEAISHLTKGLELLETLPDTPERTQQELTLRVTLWGALAVTKGYASQEVEKAHAQALELCRQVGETPQLLRVLSGLSGFHMIRGALQKARELGE